MIDGRRTAPADVSVTKVFESPSGGVETLLSIVIHEGRNRQVRKMCESIGHPVARLRRVSIGPIADERLRPGDFRELSPEEVAALRKVAAVPGAAAARRRRARPDAARRTERRARTGAPVREDLGPEADQRERRRDRRGAIDLGVGDERRGEEVDRDPAVPQRSRQQPRLDRRDHVVVQPVQQVDRAGRRLAAIG